jgi:hypothetical protein
MKTEYLIYKSQQCAQAGYNWQIGSLVTGLEADIQGASFQGSAHAVPTWNTLRGPR